MQTFRQKNEIKETQDRGKFLHLEFGEGSWVIVYSSYADMWDSV